MNKKERALRNQTASRVLAALVASRPDESIESLADEAVDAGEALLDAIDKEDNRMISLPHPESDDLDELKNELEEEFEEDEEDEPPPKVAKKIGKKTKKKRPA
jgi:hypothetical protein